MHNKLICIISIIYAKRAENEVLIILSSVVGSIGLILHILIAAMGN